MIFAKSGCLIGDVEGLAALAAEINEHRRL
jgi:hypothetical protein